LALLAARVAGVWAKARGIAVFRCRRKGLSLLASDRVAQESIDYVCRLWTEGFEAIARGNVHLDVFGSSDRRHLVIPCLSDGRMRGLLYAEMPPGRVPPVEALQALGSVAGAILDGRYESDPAAKPNRALAAPFAEAANLRAVMQRHEWNIARVARVLGVTRMTIYNRLRRLKVRREHVRKSLPRVARPRHRQGDRPAAHAKPVLGAA
jgi:hypothetical protein